MSFETLEHVHEPQRVLEEVVRVLGPSGRALLKDAWLKTEMHAGGILPRGLRKVLGNIGSRFRRLWREITGNNDVARWPLVPDYTQIAGDHDAVSRIDAHSVFRFFRARGFEPLNECRGFFMRIFRLWTKNRHWVIVRKKSF
jgi:ubiquinone/menaquinone biosynthesis C-methylase UbiE